MIGGLGCQQRHVPSEDHSIAKTKLSCFSLEKTFTYNWMKTMNATVYAALAFLYFQLSYFAACDLTVACYSSRGPVAIAAHTGKTMGFPDPAAGTSLVQRRHITPAKQVTPAVECTLSAEHAGVVHHHGSIDWPPSSIASYLLNSSPIDDRAPPAM